MAEKIVQPMVPPRQTKRSFPFRLSLRYKLTFPVLVFVSLMLFLLFRTTYELVRDLVMERNEAKLLAITEVFADTLRVPIVLGIQHDLQAHIQAMDDRADVLEVRVENPYRELIATTRAFTRFPPDILKESFLGVRQVSPDTYAVGVMITAEDRLLGRLLVLFSQMGFAEDLKEIFRERLLVAGFMLILLALITAGVTWLAIRPLFHLKDTAQRIMAGDLDARARLYSSDEIEELGEAFNETVTRLATSLERLKSRSQALEESERKYRLTVENASDVIFVLDHQGNLILLNAGFSGCSRGELLTEGLALFLSLLSNESKEKFEEALDDVEKTKEAIMNIPMTFINRTNKEETHYLANLTPVLDFRGELKSVQGAMRDVTELRRIELMKESLIRDVAHELKTPAAKFQMVIDWFEKEISKDSDKGKYEKIIEILRNNADHLMRTISSIMDLSRLEAGMDHTTKIPLDIHEVMNQVYRDLLPLVEKKKLEFSLNLVKEPLMMHGDRDMLYRLFVNLIENAIKFTDSGSIELESRKINHRIRIAVKDTGIGIEQENLEKVFERFFQKTASAKGIGVGLTICRDIVALHQGKIWAESEGLDKGTTFQIEFPIM